MGESLDAYLKEQEERKKNSRRVPRHCPFCRNDCDFTMYPEWFAHSLEPQDLHNTVELTEWHCVSCGEAFWL